MTPSHKFLWEQIKNFKFDKPNTTFTFARRLAQENGWSMNYTDRVIMEYKKFLFLCCVSPRMVTPSDPVDQAWHLHLTYTKSYWQDMCDNILGKKIHHNPTQGGQAEAMKYNDLYTQTRIGYEEFFEQEPPKDIWQGNQERFSDIDFVRVNKRTNFIIPKLKLKRLTELFAIFIMAMGSIYAFGWGDFFMILAFVAVFILFIYWISGGGNKKRRNGGSSSGSSSSDSGGWFIFGGCGSSSGCSSHSSGSGCGSSGCSSSGCSSGCGGGCGGGGCSS